MKSIVLIILLSLSILNPNPALADSDAQHPAEQPSFWSKVWQDFKNDWIQIGKGAKESGSEVGRSVKEEVQEMPENFRKGWDAAKEDFKHGTSTPNETRSDH